MKEAKKYNNNSVYLKNWTTQKLVKELKRLQFVIFDEVCFGVSDLKEMARIGIELKERGYRERLWVYNNEVRKNCGPD